MRQLSFAFLQAGRHIVKGAPDFGETTNRLNFEPVSMRKVDPTKNMARFYSLEVERDLLERVVLVRRWGRIGTAGKIRLDEHVGEGEARKALDALARIKRRRGYQVL